MLSELEVRERIEAFEKAHGGKDAAILDESGSWYLYPDGARRERSQFGAMQGPPSIHNPHPSEEMTSWETLKRIERYHALKVMKLKKAYDEKYASLHGSDYDEHQLADLKADHEVIKSMQAELEAIEDQLREHPMVVRKRQSEEMNTRFNERISAKKERLKDLRL